MFSKSNVSEEGNSSSLEFRPWRAHHAACGPGRRAPSAPLGSAGIAFVLASCREPIQCCGGASMAVHSLMAANDGARPSSSTPNCDIEQVLELHGCRAAYERLEECLGEHDRDWSACQEPLRLLRDCYEARRQNTDEHSRPSGNTGTIQR